jgi:competence protein ComEC
MQQRLLRLSWYRTAHDLRPGQIWRADVKVRRPRGFVNPRGFDYHAWLLAQDVVATGSVRRGEIVGERLVWAGYRAELAESVLQLTDSPYRRFWRALLIGEKSEIGQGDWGRLQATGTVHLLVISGLHIGLVATWGFMFGALVGRGLGCLHRGSNAVVMQWMPPLVACAAAAFYAALAGFSIPTIRALTACLALMLCRGVGVKLPPFVLLGAAVVAVGVNEPLAWLNAGFWLSFLAVALLFYVYTGRPQQVPLRVFLSTQPMMAIGLTLPLWLVGQGASLTGPAANLLAVPVVSFVLVPTLLAATLIHPFCERLAVWLLQWMDQIFVWLWRWLGLLQELPVPLWWPTHTLTTLDLLLVSAGVVLLLAPAGLSVRGIGGLWLVVALTSPSKSDYQLRVTVMDVGQGQAVILQTPEQTWLYDAGPIYSERFDAGSRILAPHLRRLGVHRLNMMVSHADLDHAGGAEGVLAAFDIERLVMGEVLEGAAPPAELCHQGQSWQADSVTFSVLWPPEGGDYTGNNSSCVLLIEFRVGGEEVRLLLPGDVDRAVERELLKVLAEPVDWILAPHHGSNSSSSYRLLYRARPQHVVFSAGYQNRYGHPHPKVLQRYEELGAIRYNTATDGALVFTWADNGMAVTKTRESEARLWHWVPIGPGQAP